MPSALTKPARPAAAAAPAHLATFLREAPGIMQELYAETDGLLKKALILGMLSYEVKAALPWGGFGSWLRENAPGLCRVSPNGKTVQPSSRLSGYMDLVRDVLEECGIAITDLLPALAQERPGARRRALPVAAATFQPHQLLLFPEDELDAAQREIRERIENVISGRTRRELFLQFKTAREAAGPDGEVQIIKSTGAGVYHGTRKDGTPRQEKRTAEEIERDRTVGDWLLQAPGSLRPALTAWLAGRLWKHLPDEALAELHHLLTDCAAGTAAMMKSRKS